ncbi:PilX N-terminal domain-containing pilus assembly protein [Thalassotalea psychrophila]|uniref:PilX N-terminal domain-containing pilus assembly protein n=1 Tax=Thalassotalea psychrophila TaxID=3065647 RepID=A0ABY9TX01_9GAMM|nr:PilX N-terminal domain-containing pilus assembly protein [Colwelliaceae bacterium SQ149]
MSILHKNSINQKSLKKQQGMAVLITSIILLILITLVSLYLARSILLEQKLVNNDIRAKYAFESAESALNIAFTELGSGDYFQEDGTVGGITDTNNDGVNDSNEVEFTNGFAVVDVEITVVNDLNHYKVTSIGTATDGSASRTVISEMQFISPIVNTPDNPISAKGNVYFDGSGTVHNLEGHSTIWSGSDVQLKSSGAKKTYIANPNDPNYPGCMDTQDTNPCSQVLSSDGSKVGLDVIEHDTDLANLTADEMFINFFGLTPEAYKETMVSKECNDANWGSCADGSEGEVIWIDGDVTANGGTIGSVDDPCILIVDGNATFKGNPDFYGLVFVMGNMEATGNAAYYGAVVVNGSASETGSLDIWYNSGLLQDLTELGPAVVTAGSWIDFDTEL